MSTTGPAPSKRFTIPDLLRRKQGGIKITSVTAYDYTMAKLADQAGIDLLMVGDSLGMVIQGEDNTMAVTLEAMIYHTRLVMRGVKQGLVITDLPFGSYQTGPEQAMQAAVRTLKEGGCHGVKLEWCALAPEITRFLTGNGIPVIGHVGLTPQSIHAMGGFKVQGRGTAAQIIADQATALTKAGAVAIVLESIPVSLAATITRALPIPTIGIGAGPECDGQVLVLHDLLGLYSDRQPRFVKQYLDGANLVTSALTRYIQEVLDGRFPTAEHAYSD